MKRHFLLLAVMLLLVIPTALSQHRQQELQFQHFSTPDGLPNSKVHRVLQDKSGFVWIATYYGLFRYDGYEVTAVKSNLYTPNYLPHNNVLAICHDDKQRLWIGTQAGLCMMDCTTGQMQTFYVEGKSRQRVHEIIQASDGTIYIGYVRGLCRFDESTQELVELSGRSYAGQWIKEANVQGIVEDYNGDLIISTWTQGLYRYQPKEQQFFHYSIRPDQQGVDIRMQRLLRDSRGYIWLTTRNDGLLRLRFVDNNQRLVYDQYSMDSGKPSSLNTNHLVGIGENQIDHTIWIGSRIGFSIMTLDNTDQPVFTNYSTTDDQMRSIPFDVNDIICDVSGQMWIATESDGVYFTNPYDSRFDVFRPSTTGLWSTDNVARFQVDSDGDYWISPGYSVNYYGNKGSCQVLSGAIPNGIFYSGSRDAVMVALRDQGLSQCRKGREEKRYRTDNCKFLPTNNVSSFYEDAQGNWWVGTFQGLGVQYADGHSYSFDSSHVEHSPLGCEIGHITADRKGNLWLSTPSQGIIRISGQLSDPDRWHIRQYLPADGNLPGSSVFFVFCDREGRVWSGLEGEGLCLYDEAEDIFHSVHQRYSLPGDMANAMLQDDLGNLWLGTNQGLASLTVLTDSLAQIRIFTERDGLPDNFFNPLTSSQHGDVIYFGCGQGLVRFTPSASKLPPLLDVNCVITGIKVDGQSITSLPVDERHKVCDQAPEHATSLRLPASYNTIEFNFASLTYKMPQQNRYTYRLRGFDKQWHNTDATHREAHYTNLNPGRYVFEVCGTNENGDWSEVRQLSIEVLSPWWRSWWAQVLYFCAFVAGLLFFFLQARHRMALRNELSMRQIEAEKVEELNHAKLQFFANVTHELMTPLTIISASLDELREQSGGSSPLISMMGINVQRLMRLLQQILEFRKAETGNLKLRVARADLALFVQQKVESFVPLIHKRQLHVSCVCQDNVMRGYFDPDKLDKILYNLLSNAAKYTEQGGAILINLNYADADRNSIVLVVKDTGRGMSNEQKKQLFRRFYDGDYRQSHTIGTGIGLSLVHDLIQLHRGQISVESEEGKGTAFTIVLPIAQSAYDPEQIIEIEEPYDPNTVIQQQSQFAALTDDSQYDDQAAENTRPTILLVEDNDELLSVMTQLLSRDYRVLQATNGVEALDLLQTEVVQLVVTDVIMPEMDGVELTRRIKQDVEVCHIPVVMLTAKRADEDRDAAYAVGADAYLTKPFSLPALHARIESLLRSRLHAADDFRHQLTIDTDQLHFTDIDQQFLSRAVDCVNRHMSDASFDVLQFAAEMGASRSTLYKKLRSLTNLNPTGFVRNIRLKAASQILQQNPTVRINELAYSVGFNDPKYFSICFKKEFGIQPTEYSHRLQGGESID